MGVLGRFGKLLILYSIASSRLPAAGGHVTITGRGFGWNPRIVSVRIGDLLAADVSLPSGHTFPVPQLVGQTIVALAPPGSGARGQPLTVSIQDEFSDSSFSATLAGLVFYAAPEIAEVMPTQLRLAAIQAFEATQFVITIQGTNFGLVFPTLRSLPARIHRHRRYGTCTYVHMYISIGIGATFTAGPGSPGSHLYGIRRSAPLSQRHAHF